MKKTIFTMLLALLTACAAQAGSSIEAARALAHRIVPGHARYFCFKQIKPQQGRDVFVLRQHGKKIVVGGSSANAMAMGLNYYLNNYCQTTVSWYAEDTVAMPRRLPAVTQSVVVRARVQNRFFLNYCTYGYTMPFWGWAQWERVIDWMALNGVNMPLAITGQETVWRNVWRKLGMTDGEIRAYFTGPAYLPWHRMANIDAWNGPLPDTWLDRQADLQRRIVRRERQLDMKPVLPAFAGHVPAQLKRVFPQANIKYLGRWAGFDDQYRCHFLDPSDSLFAKIQRMFIQEQTRMYGSDHIYGADPFNEVDPPSWDTGYLARVADGIYQSMASADPEAHWMQMAWLFWHGRKKWTPQRVKALLTGVRKGRMVMLDYFCENKEIWKLTDGFYRQPYIWCYLGNFGGNTTLTGNLKESVRRLENALAQTDARPVGIGGTLEGFDINQMPYELMMGKAWEMPIDDDEWMERLADRHLGYSDGAARQAWRLLYDEVLVQAAGSNGILATYRPKMGDDAWHYTHVDYAPDSLAKAWRLMAQVPKASRVAYVCDLIAVGRQVLGNRFMDEKVAFDKAFYARDTTMMRRRAAMMMGLLGDIDTLCAYNAHCTLEKWIADARAYATCASEADYYELNARNLISTWGGKLNDYANRAWSGMLGTYYVPRWTLYVSCAMKAAKAATAFDQAAYDSEVGAFERRWVNGHGAPHCQPRCDILTYCRRLMDKYGVK